MRKIILGIAVLLLMVSVGHCQDQPLQLTIKSEKEVYEPGDDITIYCKVKNISDEVVKFHKDSNPTHCNLKVTYENDKKCRFANTRQVTRGSCSIVSLKPKEALEYSFKGKILKGEVFITRGGKSGGVSKVHGVYIEFPTWAVLLDNGYSKYDIETRYRDGSGWLYMLSEHKIVGNKAVYSPEFLEQFKDKWQGTLTSNTITIEVEEKK